jgi:hypothetical protein
MHVAVLVPFRDEPTQNRAAHLAAFRAHMPPLLDAALGTGNWSIHIGVQGCDGHKFSRGRLLNALTRIVAETLPTCTRLVMHDVDLLPDAVRAAGYGLPMPPGAQILALNTTGEYAGMKDYVGGICAIDVATFAAVNGFPNEMEGWGGEDDALRSRLAPGCIAFHTAGSVRNLELESGDAFVRARDAPQFKMPKEERWRVRDLWRKGDPAITGYAELVFAGARRVTNTARPAFDDLVPSDSAAVYVYDLDVFSWGRGTSASTGRAYYFNSTTQCSQWSPPAHV